MIWDLSGLNFFHWLILKFKLLCYHLFDFSFSNWCLFCFNSKSKTEWYRNRNIKFFSLLEVVIFSNRLNLVFFSLNAFFFDRSLELFIITTCGSISLTYFFLTSSSFFFLNSLYLNSKVCHINLMLHFYWSSSICEEIQNLLNININVSLVHKSDQSLLNILFFNISVSLGSD